MQNAHFTIRGVIEGFYGTFYTWAERKDLIQFIGTHGYNLYIYAPKNDRQHRVRWWEPYSPATMDQFAETVELARSANVQFCYAISPLNYDAPSDFPKLTHKLKQMFDRGVRDFSLLVDDLLCAVHRQPNCPSCVWPCEHDITLCNQVYDWLVSLDPACTLSMCPTEYHGQLPFSSYLHELGAGLRPEIDVFYTGPKICSPKISAADAEGFAQAVRRPPLIWDNYPVNDLAMRPYMHIGPIRGRDAALAHAARGIVVNTMIQPEASKIPLFTWAQYFADPAGYDAWAAWQRALIAVGGAGTYQALRRFAENSLQSCLGLPEPTLLERRVYGVLNALVHGEHAWHSPALAALNDYLDVLDEACYVLKHRMENARLRHELLPWVEALDDWLWVGKRAGRLIEAMADVTQRDHLHRELKQSIEEAQFHRKRTSGNLLLELAHAVLKRAEELSAFQTGGEAEPGGRVQGIAA